MRRGRREPDPSTWSHANKRGNSRALMAPIANAGAFKWLGRDVTHEVNKSAPGPRPVFDRGSFEPVRDHTQPPITPATRIGPQLRTAADRQVAKEVVTARLLGDPPPNRAGRAPDCEESLRAERSAEAYRLIGREPPQEGYGVLDLERVQERQARLAPRRWRPNKEAAE